MQTSLREAVELLLQTCTDRDFDANAPCTEEDSCVHAFGMSHYLYFLIALLISSNEGAAFQDCVHVGLNPNLSWWNLLSSCSLIINEPILTQSVEIADMLCPVRTFSGSSRELARTPILICLCGTTGHHREVDLLAQDRSQ